MADLLDVVDFETVRSMLKVPDTQLVLLGSYITAVSRHIDDLCGPVVARTITAETHHGTGCSILLRKYPVLSVTTVTEDALTLTGTDYHLDLETGILERVTSPYYPRYWNYGRWNVSVTYVAGRYATTALVDSVFQNAATMAVKGLWTSQQGFGGSSTFGAYSGDLVDNAEAVGGNQYVLPKAAYMLLRPYIQARVGVA